MPARSHEQTRDALQEWLYDNHPKDSYPWCKSVFDGTFVYQYDGKLYQRTYDFDSSGNLSVGPAEEVAESYDPIASMAAFAIDGQAVFDGETVTRTGKLFEVGDWPDKGFSLTSDEMKSAVAAFQPVHNDLEHRDTILKEKIGKLESVEARGNELFGTVSIPKWLNDTIKDVPLKVSLAWDRATKKIVGNGLVLNPRIADAQVFAAFTQYQQPRRGPVMDILSKLKAIFSGSTSAEHQLTDAEKAELAKFAGNPPAPVGGPPLESIRVGGDLARGLVGKHPLDAVERKEDGRRKRGRLAAAGDLAHPALEGVERDPADGNAGRAGLVQHSPELLAGRDEVDDHECPGLHGAGAVCESSISTPSPAEGWRNATRLPPAPGTGISFTSRKPRSWSSASVASSSSTAKQR